MFGTLRLFLATMVVVFHAGYRPFDVRIGVSAVVVFFMLSGFVITGLFEKRFKNIRGSWYFYLERFVRIAPQYYFFLGVTSLCLFGFDLWFAGFPERSLTRSDIACNLMLLPLALLIYLPGLFDFAIIGQAVSLANECIFYLLAPVIFMHRAIALGAYLVSFAVFGLASHGILSMVAYSYNYLPGPLIFFLLGHFLYRRQWWTLGGAVVLLVTNQVSLWFRGDIASGFNLDMYVGVYFGLAAIQSLRGFRQHVVDEFAGAAAYGCFLGHYTILIVLRHFGVYDGDQARFAVLLIVSSVGLGFLSFLLVERPTIELRRRLRSS